MCNKIMSLIEWGKAPHVQEFGTGDIGRRLEATFLFLYLGYALAYPHL
jgi:hypothetical protein